MREGINNDRDDDGAMIMMTIKIMAAGSKRMQIVWSKRKMSSKMLRMRVMVMLVTTALNFITICPCMN